jgi:hypothetical protein
MALVRCPKHNVPYNDANPRGCPACHQERQGGGQATLMRDLARASQGVPRVEILPPPEADEPVTAVIDQWGGSVTQPPRVPTPQPSTWQKLVRLVRANALVFSALGLGIVGVVILWSASRPAFEQQPIPAHIAGDALPFPAQPNVAVAGVFALLGAVPPQINPDSPTLARYDYGRGAVVDVLNGIVYAVTLTTPERAWNGARVGLDETRARGHLALLGEVRQRDVPSFGGQAVGNYIAYPTLAALPHRVLVTAVRPPNGCFDVEMDLAPQVIGYVTRDDQRFIAVARRGSVPWDVVHRVRVVSRAMAGPYAGPPVC